MLRRIELAEAPAELLAETCFWFKRRLGSRYKKAKGVEVWFRQGVTRICIAGVDGSPMAPDLRGARELAKAYASEHGLPYREVDQEPEESADEERRRLRGEGRRRIASLDMWAEQDETGTRVVILGGERKATNSAVDYKRAAEMWIRSAEACEQQVRLEPGSVSHLRQCAADRVGEAMECLTQWRRQLALMPEAAGLRKIDGGGDAGRS